MGRRLYAISVNTFREAVRDRVLVGLLGITTALLLFTTALGELSLENQRRVIIDNGIASVSLFAVLAAIFLGSSLLYKEIERKTLYVILPKPIRRSEFLVGKYIGIVLTGGVFVVLMGAIQIWILMFQGGRPLGRTIALPAGLFLLLALSTWRFRDSSFVLIPWSLVALAAMAYVAGPSSSEIQVILAAMTLIFCELLVLTAVALLFSAFSTPFLTGIFSLGIWVIGRSADDLVMMKSRVVAPWIKTALRGTAEVVPNFNLFFPGRHSLEARMVEALGPWHYVGTTLGYAVLYSTAALFCATLIFRGRDLL